MWVETFTAIGEDNALEEIKFKDPTLAAIHRCWNDHQREDSKRRLMEKINKVTPDNFDKSVDGIYRTTKVYMKTRDSPNQVLLSDALLSPLMAAPNDRHLTQVVFQGYTDRGYPHFEPIDHGNIWIANQRGPELRAALQEEILKELC